MLVELTLNPASPLVWDAKSESFLSRTHTLPVRARAEGAEGASHLNTSQEVAQRGTERVNKQCQRERGRERDRQTDRIKKGERGREREIGQRRGRERGRQTE